MTTRLKAALCAGVTFGAAFGCLPAFAQVAPPSPGPAATPTPVGATAAQPLPAKPRQRPADTSSAQEVIVTARRVAERLQDVPISITVFNQQQLTNRNIVTAGDLAIYTPSLTTNSIFGPENTSFAIRGFTQEIGTTPSVAVYFADVVAPRAGGSATTAGEGAGPGNFFDLQNVQVLKGPQGTLFGRNTTGGAVLLVPQKPTSKLEGYLEGTAGDYGELRLQGALNVPINDRVRLRVGFDRNADDGYLNNTSGIGPSHFNNTDYIAIRGSLVVDVTNNIENYTIANYTRSNTNGPLAHLFAFNGNEPFLNASTGSLGFGPLAGAQINNPANQGFYSVQNDVPNARELIEQYQVINTTTWRATDNLTIKNIASYGEFKEEFNASIFGEDLTLPSTIPVAFGGASFTLPTGKNAGKPFDFVYSADYPGSYFANQSTLSEEVQLQGRNFADRFTWQAGAYYEISQPIGFPGARSPLLIDCTNAQTLKCEDILGETLGGVAFGNVGDRLSQEGFRNLAAYGQGTVKITDQLSFTGGVRYTSDRTHGSAEQVINSFPSANVSVATCSNTLAFPNHGVVTNPSQCRVNLSTNSEAPTWLLDLDYKPINDMLIYAKFSRGYRQGGINNGAPGLEVFGPESVDSYEAGTKNTFRGPLRATFDTAFFYNKLDNQQLQANIAGPTFGQSNAVVNAGQSQIYGIEGEGSITPFAGFTLDAAMTYLNTLLLSNTPPILEAGSPVTSVELTATAGHELTFAPTYKTTLTASYALPLDPDVGRVILAGTYVYTSGQVSTEASAFGKVPATNILNVNLNWNAVFGRPVDASVFITNVTDLHYFTAISGAYNTVGYESAQLGAPRMFGVRLRYHFNQ